MQRRKVADLHPFPPCPCLGEGAMPVKEGLAGAGLGDPGVPSFVWSPLAHSFLPPGSHPVLPDRRAGAQRPPFRARPPGSPASSRPSSPPSLSDSPSLSLSVILFQGDGIQICGLLLMHSRCQKQTWPRPCSSEVGLSPHPAPSPKGRGEKSGGLAPPVGSSPKLGEGKRILGWGCRFPVKAQFTSPG